MLYSPLDHHEDDDFSHLPTVDGAPPPRPAGPEPVPGPLASWDQPDIAPSFEAPPSEPSEPSPLHSQDSADNLPPLSDSSVPPENSPPPAGSLHIQPVMSSDDPEAPADITPQIHQAKKRAFLLAAGAHLFLLLILAIIQVAPMKRPVSEIVAISAADTDQPPAWKKVAPPTPAPSGGPGIKPVIALGSSQIALPDVDFTPTATELNVGSTFGTFGGGSGSAGGSVSFMGNQGKGSRVVFVVDVSGSMSASSQAGGKTISRFDLLKKELVKSLNQLRGSVQYQVIYFSDFAWPHDEVDTNDAAAMAKYEWDIRPGQQGARIPRYRYLAATPGNLAKSRQIINDSINPGGTNWGSGLLMALAGSPKPDLVFFMTDGNKSDALTWVDEVTAANARGKPATIHTTALMAPGAARDLDELARRNRGKFTIIEADGKVVKGEDYFKSNPP